ncbi:MAG: ParA family protein [Polyangiaceae bacterium]
MLAVPPEPKTILRCASFHSVKGGVGKSTLSYLVARLLAEASPPDERVALIDADLTGTSLADVLPLRAPKWSGLDGDDPLPLHRKPDHWIRLDHVAGGDDSFAGLVSRATREVSHAHDVPLLNDFLLWRKDRYDSERDVHPEALFWKPPAEDVLAERLMVVPSSALPTDLGEILPLIYDELHAAYLESRLEWLLHWLLAKTNVRTVVFDTPPTIPGLSRALLSMGIRLPDHVELADDGGTPERLTREAGTSVTWTAFLIASTDLQDLRAAERWLDGRSPEELDRIQVIVNRAERSDPVETLRAEVVGTSPETPGGAPVAYGGNLLVAPVVVEASSELRVSNRGPLSQPIAEQLAPLVARIRDPGAVAG